MFFLSKSCPLSTAHDAVSLAFLSVASFAHFPPYELYQGMKETEKR